MNGLTVTCSASTVGLKINLEGNPINMNSGLLFTMKTDFGPVIFCFPHLCLFKYTCIGLIIDNHIIDYHIVTRIDAYFLGKNNEKE